MRRSSEIGKLVANEPAKARAAVLRAYKKAGMHQATAAELLDVNPATLRRIVAKLGMGDAVQQLGEKAREEGWFRASVNMGWRKGRKRGKWSRKRRVEWAATTKKRRSEAA